MAFAIQLVRIVLSFISVQEEPAPVFLADDIFSLGKSTLLLCLQFLAHRPYLSLAAAVATATT